jgi:lipopolysaccharide assembly protein A
MVIFILILLVLVVFLLIFTLQNPEGVAFRLLFWQLHDVPIVLVVLAAIITGYLLAEIIHRPKIWRLRRQNKRLRKYKRENEKLKRSGSDENNPEGQELGDDDIESIFDE